MIAKLPTVFPNALKYIQKGAPISLINRLPYQSSHFHLTKKYHPYSCLIPKQVFYLSNESLNKSASQRADQLEQHKAKIKQTAHKIGDAASNVQTEIVKTHQFVDGLIKRFKEIIAALVCLITGINEFLHSTLNAELKKIKDSIKKEQQDSRGKKVKKRIDNIMKKQKVDPQISEINFHYKQALLQLLQKSNQHNIILIQGPKNNCLSTFCKSVIQKFDRQNEQKKGSKASTSRQKSQLNKYDEYRYVDLKSLVFCSQNGNEVFQEFTLYLQKMETQMTQKKKTLLLIIDSIELVEHLTSKKGQQQKVNIQKLAIVLHSIEKSNVFSLALISYDPYFIQNYFFGNKRFKNYNLLFDTVDALNKQDVNKLIKKKLGLDFPKFTDFISQRHNSESQVLKILNFCKILKEQSKLLQKRTQFSELLPNKASLQAINLVKKQITEEQELVLKKAQKMSSQILNENKKLIDRSINKVYANLANDQEYSRQVKIIDAKRTLLQEAITKGAIDKNFMENFEKEQQKILFTALKELNQEEILFGNSFTSFSIKKGVEICLSEYLKPKKK